uniref:Putative ovule protein n=1 Tax=Solanum chacoense TaxID=4108 RepID=A0A0V0GZB1_SOLCH
MCILFDQINSLRKFDICLEISTNFTLKEKMPLLSLSFNLFDYFNLIQIQTKKIYINFIILN